MVDRDLEIDIVDHSSKQNKESLPITEPSKAFIKFNTMNLISNFPSTEERFIILRNVNYEIAS